METKAFYLSKTFWLNVGTFLALALMLPELGDLIPDSAAKYVAAGNALLNLALRFFGPGAAPLSMNGNPKMIVMLLVPSLLLVGCGRRDPNLSPERSIALYATQVGGYLKETKTLADGLYSSQILPKPAYERTLEILLEVNKAGLQLTSALQAYDAATEGVAKGDAAKQVDAALIALNTLLPSVLSQVTDATGRAKISAVIESIQRLVLVIARATLPRPTAELEPMLERIEHRRAFAN
jgi:major membrane immunogen (membrane-anchored lipoprotein)